MQKWYKIIVDRRSQHYKHGHVLYGRLYRRLKDNDFYTSYSLFYAPDKSFDVEEVYGIFNHPNSDSIITNPTRIEKIFYCQVDITPDSVGIYEEV